MGGWPNTPDLRAFYEVSRAVLVLSLWLELFGRVAAEALADGLPILAMDRGASPEILGEAGFVFTLSERCTPTSVAVPTGREAAPLVAVIERLWDNAAFAAANREWAITEAARWDDDRLARRHVDCFQHQVGGR